MTTFKDRICEATDRLRLLKMDAGQGRATYDELRLAAAALLTLQREAEITIRGKSRIKVDAVHIARLIR